LAESLAVSRNFNTFLPFYHQPMRVPHYPQGDRHAGLFNHPKIAIMESKTLLEGFPGYLKQEDPSLFEIFNDQNSLGLYPDNTGEYRLMIVLPDHYYTKEQGDKLFAYWQSYKKQPVIVDSG
jgi:hypothetical protein